MLFLGAMLVNNIVLTHFLGVSPYASTSDEMDCSLGIGAAVTLILTISSAVIFPVYNFIMLPLGIEFMYIIAFILIIAGITQLTEILLRKFTPKLHKFLGIYLPLIAANCVIFGVVLMNTDFADSFLMTIAHALGAGTGFTLVTVILSGIKERLDHDEISPLIKGIPIAMIVTGFMSAIFFGFTGIVG
jgi:electron transport complex protein RnfA